MTLGNIDPTGGDGPEFTATERDGELVILVRARRGASDDDIIREARRQARTLLPARIDRSDRGLDSPRNVETFRGVYQLVGYTHRGFESAVPERPVGIVYAAAVDDVWVVDLVRIATLDERRAWAAKDDTHADYVDRGGRLCVIEVTRVRDGVEGTVTVANYYNQAFKNVWVVPLDQHWPRCSICREPWPCRHRDQQTSDYHADQWERRRCYRCGKTDGNQHVFKVADGFPERRSYHLRKGACLNAAVRYANEHGWELDERHGWRTFRQQRQDDTT